ncbi:S-adenosyl-L-methionine-dependent methyltransferase [Xylariaceae sp. FL1272]|nr:S-adenosyl-L-methionine-dependent methyltransferase [Xylariaceae sp. FL1272]
MCEGTLAHEYVLNRDYQSSARLNLQHYLWVKEVGYDLHPRIELRPGMTVADVATGTGVWAIDLAFQFPGVKFHISDVNLEQTPPAKWLPSNVESAVIDVLKPMPRELHGKFDVVHSRLLMCVIGDDPAFVLGNLKLLLKPGGWLQWDELDHPSHRFDTTSPDLPYTYVKKAGEFPSSLGYKDSRMDARWVNSLRRSFEENGLLNIIEEHKYRDPYRLAYYSDTAFMTWEEWRQKMSSEDAIEYSTILKQAWEEVTNSNRGVSINMELRTVVGQKASVRID